MYLLIPNIFDFFLHTVKIYVIILKHIYRLLMKGAIAMRKWVSPAIEELQLKYTASIIPWIEDEQSNEEELLPIATPTPAVTGTVDQDLGTCSNPFWYGNGMTHQEAVKNNPFWGGAWGK
ncbi:MAG: hypothetical protein IJZ55_00130 [Lachnospiraceae bacterium]|nr:hypothetical protein [Lachnospiraceae bacterium]